MYVNSHNWQPNYRMKVLQDLLPPASKSGLSQHLADRAESSKGTPSTVAALVIVHVCIHSTTGKLIWPALAKWQ